MKLTLKSMQTFAAFSAGIIAHHYGSKLLDRNLEIELAKDQKNRDLKMDEIAVGIKKLVNDSNKIGNTKIESISANKEELNRKAETLQNKANKIMECLNNPSANSSNKDELLKNVKDMVSETDRFRKLINEFSSNPSNNKLINGFNEVYEYLDSLSLLQECALLHFIIFNVIIFTMINILLILFSNRIIKYFDLENKYPKLSNLLKLRSKFQKYSLTFNVVLLFSICILGLVIDALTFFY